MRRAAPDAEAAPARAIEIGDLVVADARAIARIDARHTGAEERRRRDRIVEGARVGLAARVGGRLVGYLLGEVRAFEFGSEPCGWVLALAVDPALARRGVATALLAEANRRFAEAGVPHVRTMVRRNDVPVLSFFRGNGFVGGPFVQLELEVGGGAAPATPSPSRGAAGRSPREEGAEGAR